jgi:NADPH2:quinone reductase
MTATSWPPGFRVVVTELGEDPAQAIEKLTTLVSMDAPDPATLGPRDVLLAVKSAAVGWVDLLMTSGQYQHRPKPPYTPGLEYAGVVLWKGTEAGDALAVGDQVLVDGMIAGPRSLGAYQSYGGFASYAVAPAEAVLRIPGGLSFDQACNLLGNYATAYHCLIQRGRLAAGETVLIHGAAGATGLAAVQVAKLLGAHVIATGRSDAKLAVVREHGADHVLNITRPDGAAGVRELRDEVKALTGGRGVDVVYDSVGASTFDKSLLSLRPRGMLALFGQSSGRVPPLDLQILNQRGSLFVTRPTLRDYMATRAELLERAEDVLGAMARGELAVRVHEEYPLHHVAEAHRALEGRRTSGKLLLLP